MLIPELPNLFDQYSQYENRVTNALLQTLASSPRLARSFLKEFVGVRCDPRRQRLIITAQKRPGEHGDRGRTREDAAERDTVPDGWLACEDQGWAVVIESKVQRGKLRLDQILGHLRGDRAYPQKRLLVLTPDESPPQEVQALARRRPGVSWHSWSEVHRWVSRALGSREDWQIASILLRSLKGFLEMDETLSGFQGIDFRGGYDTRKAKAFLKALMEEVRPTVLKSYPDLQGGRGSITTFDAGVWDCFGVEPKFTDDLHLTLEINEPETAISITLPNAAKERWRRLRFILEDPILYAKLQRTMATIRKEVPELWIRLDQRHYIAQRFRISDARLDLKVDTADFLRPSRAVKRFPLWFRTAREAVLARRGINLQFQVRACFPHGQIRDIGSPHFAKMAARTLKNFKPLFGLMRA